MPNEKNGNKELIKQRTNQRIELTSTQKSIHFLRGVNSRAGIALAHFYLILSTNMQGSNTCMIAGYPGQILQSAVHFSSLNTVALICRKVFDHSTSGLTGAQFGKQSDATLDEHAFYWSKHSERPIEEARRALTFLRAVFKKCSKSIEMSRQDGALLCRRIGAVKEYANNEAAHISLNDYRFEALDLAHIVAALTLIGEIIRTFDDIESSPSYFDDLDSAAYEASRRLFPDAPRFQLFGVTKVREHAQSCLKRSLEFGIEMLVTNLPNVLGGPLPSANAPMS